MNREKCIYVNKNRITKLIYSKIYKYLSDTIISVTLIKYEKKNLLNYTLEELKEK